MSARLISSSFTHIGLDSSPFRSENTPPSSSSLLHPSQHRPQSPPRQSRHISDQSPSDGRTLLLGVKMETPAPANGTMSSTVEEPAPDFDTVGVDNNDKSQQPADTERPLSPSRYSSSSSNSSFSSVSSVDQFEARYRRFPPLPPSSIQPNRPFPSLAKLAAPLAVTSKFIPTAALSDGESTSATDGSSSVGGEEGTVISHSEDADDDDDDDEEVDEEDDDDNDDDGDDSGSVAWLLEDSRVQSLWSKLGDQRDTVRKLRLDLLDKRRRLRDLRKKKDEADNRFMGMVRPFLVAGHGLGSPGDMIIRQFDLMQKESNEYHDEEAEVEQLEHKLEDEEVARETLETQFFTVLYGASGGGRRREDSLSEPVPRTHVPPSRASLLGITADRPDDIHPLYKRLLEAVGDRELAKEELAELQMYRESILYDLQLAIKRGRLREAEGRSDKTGAMPDSSDLELLNAIADDPSRLDELQPKYRTSIGRDNEEFLRDFAKEQAMLHEKLVQAKEEVDRLRKLCQDKGAMPKNRPYNEEYIIFADVSDSFSADTMSFNENEVRKQVDALANPRFPILLSNPRHVLQDDFPLTAREAYRAATRLPSDDRARPKLVAEALKEYGIETLVLESAAENKNDYVNRWLLQRLRISPLEVELLYTIFSTSLQVKNTRRWQEDVLYHWSRDEGNKPKEYYDGAVTSRGTLSIDNDLASGNINSALGKPVRWRSDSGGRPRARHGPQEARISRSVS